MEQALYVGERMIIDASTAKPVVYKLMLTLEVA